jgi:hypothetical protein
MQYAEYCHDHHVPFDYDECSDYVKVELLVQYHDMYYRQFDAKEAWLDVFLYVLANYPFRDDAESDRACWLTRKVAQFLNLPNDAHGTNTIDVGSVITLGGVFKEYHRISGVNARMRHRKKHARNNDTEEENGDEERVAVYLEELQEIEQDDEDGEPSGDADAEGSTSTEEDDDDESVYTYQEGDEDSCSGSSML